AGYAVVACADGEAAVAAASAARAGSLALLVADVVMPDAAGPSTARRVLALQPSSRVLYMSGHSLETLRRSGLVEGDVDLLRKPFTPDVLLSKIRAVLDASRFEPAACASA